MSIMFLWGDCLKAHLGKGTSRESMGGVLQFIKTGGGLQRTDENKVTSRFYHTIRNIEGIHKLASLSTTLTLNMQL
jgi:hypothetical protein